MKKDTKVLLALLAVLTTVLAIWSFTAPEQRELRMPVWLLHATISGMLLDRWLNKRL